MKRYSGKKHPAGGLATPQNVWCVEFKLPKLSNDAMFTKQTIG